MQRLIIACLSLLVLCITAVGVTAQLPDEPSPTSAPPAAPKGVTPGNLKLDAVDKAAPPFGADAAQLPAPAAVTTKEGKTYAMAPSMVGSLPIPAYGYIHPFGSFQVTSTTAEGMFMLSAMLPFPDGRRTIDFYHASFQYVGRYVDPSTSISGYLYVTDIGPPVNDRRYVLFGDRDLNVQDPNSNGTRWMVYYNSNGVRVYHTTARFYRP